MFFTKRKKIDSWLKAAAPSPFSELLGQQRSGQMQVQLEAMGLTKQEYHIDWLDDYKCICIQGRYKKLYVDIQIEPDTFTIAVDKDEPDDPAEFPLTSAEGFYQAVRQYL